MLEARDLFVRFGNGFVAVDGVSLAVQGGEVLTLCGPNGAGKSTMLSMLAGDRRPTSGSVLLDGKPISHMSAADLARRRAVLEQTPSLSAPFTVEKLAGLSIGIEVSPTRAHDIVGRCLDDVGLTELAKRRADVLSGGERHRAHLARVLAQLSAAGDGEDTYLLLDEPTASLDIEHQIAVMRVARQAASRGVGVLVVLHDLNLAAAFSDRIGLMNRGRLAALGHPREVFTGDCLSQIYRTPIAVDTDSCGHIRISPRFAPTAA